MAVGCFEATPIPPSIGKSPEERAKWLENRQLELSNRTAALNYAAAVNSRSSASPAPAAGAPAAESAGSSSPAAPARDSTRSTPTSIRELEALTLAKHDVARWDAFMNARKTANPRDSMANAYFANKARFITAAVSALSKRRRGLQRMATFPDCAEKLQRILYPADDPRWKWELAPASGTRRADRQRRKKKRSDLRTDPRHGG